MSADPLIVAEDVQRLAAWLDEHGGAASRRELQRARVCGARTGQDLDALIERYEEIFAGSVAEVHRSTGGIPSQVIFAPRWRPSAPRWRRGDTEERLAA